MKVRECLKLYKEAKKEFSNDKFHNSIRYFDEFFRVSEAEKIFSEEMEKINDKKEKELQCDCEGDYLYISKAFAYKAIALGVTNQLSEISLAAFDKSLHFTRHYYCKLKNEGEKKEKEKKREEGEKKVKNEGKCEISRKNEKIPKNEEKFCEMSEEKLGKRKNEEKSEEEGEKTSRKKQKKANYYKKFVKGLKTHYQLQDHRKAIFFFSQSINIRNNFPNAYLSRGISYLILDEYQNAIADFNKVIELKPDHEIAYHNLGDTYSQLNDFPKSIEFYQISIQKNPNSSYVFFNRGVSYYQLGDYPLALSVPLFSLLFI